MKVRAPRAPPSAQTDRSRAMSDFLHSLSHSDIAIMEKVMRTIVVYFFLLIGLRLGGKRELGSLNPFDLVVLLVLSNTLQNAIIGPDNSLLGGMIGGATLLLLNALVVRFLFKHQKLESLVEGEALELVLDGKVLHENLTKEQITLEELHAHAREQGVDDLNEVKCARIEVGGAMTFVLKHPTPEESYETEIKTRLDRMERTLTALAARHGI
jgi:uncharacterized membrane protein YcaP (DUF421 family)